jgi:hypothetical protein
MMALIVVVMLVQNVAIRGQTLATEDWQRTNEHIVIEDIYFDLSYNLKINVTNIGSVQTHLVAVWVEPLDPQKMIKRYIIDQYLDVKETEVVTLPDSEQVLDIFEDFRVTVFTERGNLVYKKYAYLLSPSYDPQVGEGGVFRISWFYSKFSSLQHPLDSEGQPVFDAVQINKSDDYIAFYINITNVWNRPCAIEANSFVGLPTIAPPQGGGAPNFFIVKNVSYDGTPSILFDPVFAPVIVAPQDSVRLVFAGLGSTVDERNDWRWGTGYPFGTETKTEGSDIQVSLFMEAYKLVNSTYIPSGRHYGQTISTQATVLLS